MLEDDLDNIQASESLCRIKRYMTMNPYVQSNQNNHGKDQNHYVKRNKMSNQCDQHVNISNEYANEAQRK